MAKLIQKDTKKKQIKKAPFVRKNKYAPRTTKGKHKNPIYEGLVPHSRGYKDVLAKERKRKYGERTPEQREKENEQSRRVAYVNLPNGKRLWFFNRTIRGRCDYRNIQMEKGDLLWRPSDKEDEKDRFISQPE